MATYTVIIRCLPGCEEKPEGSVGRTLASGEGLTSLEQAAGEAVMARDTFHQTWIRITEGLNLYLVTYLVERPGTAERVYGEYAGFKVAAPSESAALDFLAAEHATDAGGTDRNGTAWPPAILRTVTLLGTTTASDKTAILATYVGDVREQMTTDDNTAPRLTPDQLAEIRARADAATEGPWQVTDLTREGDKRPYLWVDVNRPDMAATVAETDSSAEGTEIIWGYKDAASIAAARTDVIRLLDEIDRLNGEGR